MDRAAFVLWFIATIALIDIGLISMPIVLARKGFLPRRGLYLGPLLGLAAALVGLFILKPLLFLPIQAAESVSAALFEEEHEIIDGNWNGNGTRVIAWTEEDKIFLWALSQINAPDVIEFEGESLEHVSWSPDEGQLLAWGDDASVELWALTDVKQPRYMLEHDARVVDALWSETVGEAAKVLTWTENNTVYIWTTTENLDRPFVLPSQDDLIGATWGEADESVLLWYADGTVRIWNLTDVAANQRVSTTVEVEERMPFLLYEVERNSPAALAGLQTGDRVVAVGDTRFDLNAILAQISIEENATVQNIDRVIKAVVEPQLVTAFENAEESLVVEVQRNGNTQFIEIVIPEPESDEDIVEFDELGFEITYVGENPTYLEVGSFADDILHPPWSSDHEQLLSWSEDQELRVFDVNDLANPLTLPYGDLNIEGAIWGDSDEEVLFWTSNEVFAWNLRDSAIDLRSANPNNLARSAGILIDVEGGSLAEEAGLQSNDILLAVNDNPIDVAQLIDDNNIIATTTNQYNRAIAPIVEDIIGQALAQANLNGESTISLEVYRGGERLIVDVAVPTSTPLLNANVPFINIETVGIEVEYVAENPRSIAIEDSILDAAVNADNTFIALQNADADGIANLTIWGIQSDRAEIHLSDIEEIEWSENGDYLLAWTNGTNEVYLFDTDNIEAPENITTNSAITTVSWSPDDESFFIAEANNEIHVWTLADLNVPDIVLNHEADIVKSIWNPDDSRRGILALLSDGSFKAWNLQNLNDSRSADVNYQVTFAEDLNFGYKFGSSGNFLPIGFEVEGAPTETIEFLRALVVGLITFGGGYTLLRLAFLILPNQRSDIGASLGQQDLAENTKARQIRGRVLQIHYFVAIIVGMIALTALMWNIVKGTFTLTAVSNRVEPASITDGRELGELESDELADLLVEYVRPGILRDLVRENVWGISAEAAQEQRDDLITETSLGDSIPDGTRVPSGVTYGNLDEYPSLMRDLLAVNLDRTTLELLAIVSQLDDEELGDTLFSLIDDQRALEIITEAQVWPDLTNPDVQPYDPETLQTELNLETTPPEGLRYEDLINYPDYLRQSITRPQGYFGRGAIEDLVIAELQAKIAGERAELVEELFASMVEVDDAGVEDASALRDLLVDIGVLFEPPEDDFIYQSSTLQSRLGLDVAPANGLSFEELGADVELLREAYLDTEIVTDYYFYSILLNEVYGFDTSDLQIAFDDDTPRSILNRQTAEAIVNSEFHTAARTREIIRIYAWGATTDEARAVINEPLIQATDLTAPPMVPSDLTFIDLADDVESSRYFLLENLGTSDIETLVIDQIIDPFVVRTWSLDHLLLHRIRKDILNVEEDSIERELMQLNEDRRLQAEADGNEYNDAELEFRSWLNLNFLRRTLNASAELTGMRNAILGTLWMIGITIFFAFPIGIGAAIYLEEYASDNLINRIIQTNIDNLAGVPSIIYGLLGVTIFVRTLEPLTSGELFGYGDPTTANGRTVLSAALTMALLILPIIIINAQEAIGAVQESIRRASYGLGATKWQTVWNHVLPYSMPGILTGTILAVSRAIGETAPLIVVGAATFILQDPNGPFSKFTALPIQIYYWTAQPRDADKAVAAAAIIVLLAILLTLNSIAVILRNRFERQMGR